MVYVCEPAHTGVSCMWAGEREKERATRGTTLGQDRQLQ